MMMGLLAGAAHAQQPTANIPSQVSNGNNPAMNGIPDTFRPGNMEQDSITAKQWNGDISVQNQWETDTSMPPRGSSAGEMPGDTTAAERANWTTQDTAGVSGKQIRSWQDSSIQSPKKDGLKKDRLDRTKT